MPTPSRHQVTEYSQVGDSDRNIDENGEFSDLNKGHTGKSRNQPPCDPERRGSFASDDEDPLLLEIPIGMEEKEKPVTWRSLPRKRQLAILTLARLSEPLVQSSLRVSIPTGSKR